MEISFHNLQNLFMSLFEISSFVVLVRWYMGAEWVVLLSSYGYYYAGVLPATLNVRPVFVFVW